MAVRTPNTFKVSMIRLAIEEACHQAEAFSFFTDRVVKVDIKAELSAPTACRVKSVSEARLAAKKASCLMAGKVRVNPASWPNLCYR